MTSATPSLARPLLLWLVLQLAVLALGAAGVPLSAHRQLPPELLAFDIMLIGQVCLAALLWPWLAGDWRAAVAVVITSIPFLQAAAFLSATPRNLAVPCEAMAILWLAALSILPACEDRPTMRRVLRWTVTVPIAGLLLQYLRLEFSGDSSADWLGPITQIARRLNGETSSMPWIWLAGVLLLAATLRAIARLKPALPV